jgi:hypothetical protein
MTDRLAEIKRRRQYAPKMLLAEDADWLIGEAERLRGLLAEIGEGLTDQQLAVRWQLVRTEVERLRGLLGRLEWGYDGCPACGAVRVNGHSRSCWLAAELNPPGAPPRPAGAAPSSGP